MANNDNTVISTIAIIVSLVALLGIAGIVVFYQPQCNCDTTKVDINTYDIATLKLNLNNLKTQVSQYPEVNQDDLDDLEYDLKKYCRNEVDDGENWYDMNSYEYNCLMDSTNYSDFKDCLD